MGEVEAKGDREERHELRHDRYTVSMLTEHFVFSPKYRRKVLLGEGAEAAEEKMRNKALKLKMLLTMALLFFAIIPLASIASAADIYVPNDYAKIQWAVDNATEGDTIIVRDGMYNENVEVNVDHLTTRSENGSATTTVQAASSSNHVFNVTADWVNITGFTVTGATGSNKAGIHLVSADHCNISNNNALDNCCGILIYSSSSNNTLQSNTANSNNGWGIWLWSSGNNNTLLSNTANSNNMDGIYLHSSSNNTFMSNIANSNSRYGIYLYYLCNNNTFTNNTANSNNWSGISLNLLCKDNILMSNTASSNTEYGIYLDNSDSNNISCNWVAHNQVSGFYLTDGSTCNTIEYNNIMANGVSASGSWHYNFYNHQSDDVAAENNYWGTDSETLIAESIYDKSDGGSWYGTVDFEPFKADPLPCAPIPELPTIILFSIGLLVLAGYVLRKRF